MSDSVKHCPVHKDLGCAHVDGYLCDYPNCTIMKRYIEAGAEIHSGDGGYSIGTKKAYEAFVKQRNYPHGEGK